MKTGTLLYEDLVEEGAPLFRDRASELDMAEKGYHPLDTGIDSVIRWVAIALRSPADADVILGYAVVGGELSFFFFKTDIAPCLHRPTHGVNKCTKHMLYFLQCAQIQLCNTVIGIALHTPHAQCEHVCTLFRMHAQ